MFARTLAITTACLLITLSAEPKTASLLQSATFCAELEENQAPKGKAEFFYPTDTVNLSIELKGRPKSGVVKASFIFRDEVVVETSVDVATVNKGVLLSAGQNTFVGFTLKPKGPLPVGNLWRVHVIFGEEELGSFGFRVAPPKEALPSKLLAGTLAKDVTAEKKPVNESRIFGRGEEVNLVGRAALGIGCWMEANWYVNGKLAAEGTRSFTAQENIADTPFYFSLLPKTGWPEGEHEVVLLINGEPAAREKFSIDPAIPVNKILKVASLELSTKKENPVESVRVGEKIVYVTCHLERAASLVGCRFVWHGIENGKEVQIAEVKMPQDAISSLLSSNLSFEKGFIAGDYRVDLLQGEKVIAQKKFSALP